jgi:hypothetical protein
MATWKVIALISGNIEAVSGPAAHDRPGTHEWIVWEVPAGDKAEALQSAEKADPRVIPIGIAQLFSFWTISTGIWLSFAKIRPRRRKGHQS